MTITTSPDVKPPVAGTYERSLDPWHADAFVGTHAEDVFEREPVRREGWALLDWVGNEIGWVSDGTEYEV